MHTVNRDTLLALRGRVVGGQWLTNNPLINGLPPYLLYIHYTSSGSRRRRPRRVCPGVPDAARAEPPAVRARSSIYSELLILYVYICISIVRTIPTCSCALTHAHVLI